MILCLSKNVNAASGAYQASSAEAQKTQQSAPENTQNSASISQTADTVEISPNTERLQAQYGIENAGVQSENDLSAVYPDETPEAELTQDTNNAPTGLVNAAVPKERPAEGAGEQGVTENKTEQLQQRQQAEKTTAAERDTTNPNQRLDLTV